MGERRIATRNGQDMLVKKRLRVAIHGGNDSRINDFAGLLAEKINKSEFPCHRVAAKQTSSIINGRDVDAGCKKEVRQALSGKKVDFIIDFEAGSELAVYSNIYSFDKTNAVLIGDAIMRAMCSKEPKVAEIEPLYALREKLRAVVKEVWAAPGLGEKIMEVVDEALNIYKTDCTSGHVLSTMERRLDAFMHNGQKEKVIYFYQRAGKAVEEHEKGALLYSGRMVKNADGTGRKRAVLIEAPAAWFTVLADRFCTGIIDGMQSVLGNAPCK